MNQWTNQQKAEIALEYFRRQVARCPVDKAILRVADITGDGDSTTVIAAYCPLCGNDMESSDVQNEIVAASASSPSLTDSGPAGSGDLVMTNAPSEPPKAFMSYSWDDDDHKRWVKSLATRLRRDGVDVKLDQWEVVPGDQLPRYMETAIRENSYVLIVCTPNYKQKSDGRKGGVGYEGDIMTAEVHTKRNHRKFIPILRSGTTDSAMPSWLKGKYRIDLSADPYSEDQYQDLLVTLHNQREQAPPVGKSPAFSRGSRTTTAAFSAKSLREEAEKSYSTKETGEADFQPIKIEGVLADQVGQPRKDGSRGSALYAVPLKLNRTPSSEWCDLFIRAWDHPPEYTTSHRPGIAEVRGDRIILTRTTMEELRDVHRNTLKLAVDLANAQAAELVQERRAASDTARQQADDHRTNVREVADDMNFD